MTHEEILKPHISSINYMGLVLQVVIKDDALKAMAEAVGQSENVPQYKLPVERAHEIAKEFGFVQDKKVVDAMTVFATEQSQFVKKSFSKLMTSLREEKYTLISELTKSNNRISELENQIIHHHNNNNGVNEQLAAKDKEIAELKAKLEKSKEENDLYWQESMGDDL